MIISQCHSQATEADPVVVAKHSSRRSAVRVLRQFTYAYLRHCIGVRDDDASIGCMLLHDTHTM